MCASTGEGRAEAEKGHSGGGKLLQVGSNNGGFQKCILIRGVMEDFSAILSYKSCLE